MFIRKTLVHRIIVEQVFVFRPTRDLASLEHISNILVSAFLSHTRCFNASQTRIL